ncbi:MAG: type II secretion system F family protein [Planctomycetia bacterium]
MSRPALSGRLLADWADAFANALDAGIGILQALKISQKHANPKVRVLSRTLVQRLKAGDDLVAALNSAADFPPLFLSMAAVAGRTGHLPEILRELGAYYRQQESLRREFLRQIFPVVAQLLTAIAIIAALIFLLGWIASSRGGQPLDVLGLGLVGTTGALAWLGAWAALFVGGYFGYLAAKKTLQTRGVVDRALLKVPVLGRTLQLLALSRFCLAAKMTLDTSLPVDEALSLSLAATDNGAYMCLEPLVAERLRGGVGVSEALADQPVFPHDFLAVLESGEAVGAVPESLGRLGRQYEETAAHQLKILNTAAGWCVWALVAGMIIFFIYRIFTVAYMEPMQRALNGQF